MATKTSDVVVERESGFMARPAGRPPDGRRWVGIALRTGLIVLFLWMIRSFLVPLALGGVFALLLAPIQQRLAARLGRARRLSPWLITTASMVLVVVPFVAVAIESVRAVQDFLARDWGSTLADVQSFLTNGFDIFGRRFHVGGDDIRLVIQRLGERAGTLAAAFVTGAAASLPTLVIDLFLFVVALYSLLRDGDAFGQWLSEHSPFPDIQTQDLFRSIRDTVQGAVLGTVVIAFVHGGLCLLALYLFGIPNAFLLGILGFLFSFVPVIGTTPVTIGSTIYLLILGRFGGAIGMFVAAIVIGLSDNVIRPWIQGSRGHMHPLIALVSIFGGLELFGATGVFLGPVVASMALWTVDVYARQRPRAAVAGAE
jgi:predicted PurR-regulated permease PerM